MSDSTGYALVDDAITALGQCDQLRGPWQLAAPAPNHE
jgi:hypothetical protein